MKIEHKAKATVQNMTVGAMREFLSNSRIPDEATLRIIHHAGDPRDPRESSYNEMEFTWIEEDAK